MRERNRTEQYLHERVQQVFEANPDPIMGEIALRALVEEVATACGLFVGEMHSTTMLATWVGRFLDKLTAVKNGMPQEVRIGPKPVPKEAQPEAEPAPDELDEADRPPSQLFLNRRRAAGALFIEGPALADVREARDLRQWQLGALVGLSQRAISRLEHGEQAGTVEEYRKLRHALNLPIKEPGHD